MKLHIGCGSNYKKGYVNIDKYTPSHGVVDLSHDLNNPLPYDTNQIEEILGYHIFEHLDPKKVQTILLDWFRLLMPGGRLILELPEFDKVCAWYLLEGGQLQKEWIFGNQEQPGQIHYWGYTRRDMIDLLQGAGFQTIEFTDPQDYHAKEGPTMRIEAQKGTGI